jgi:hypothetical protein
VAILYPAQGDGIFYDSVTGKWTNEQPTGGGGGSLDDLTDVTITTPSDGDVLTYDSGTSEWVNAAPTGSGASYWTTLPGTPTRTGNYTLTITDTANANLYDLKFSRGTVLKWIDTTVKMAMVHSATYSSNTVTITTIGDILNSSATMSSFTYAIEKAEKVTFAIAGTIAAGTNLSRKWKADKPYRIFGADALHGTAGTTNPTTYEIEKNSTNNSVFTTDISIASGATIGNGFTAIDGAGCVTDDVFLLKCNTLSATAPIDVYIDMFIFPTYNQYL